MAVIVQTTDPTKFLLVLKQQIDSKHIETWSYDADGDYTHSPEQWARKAWLRPHKEAARVVFGILPNTKIVMTHPIYGVYHGRFIEALATHLSSYFSTAAATADYLKGYDVLPDPVK